VSLETINPTYHSKTKHIVVKYRFVRYVIEENGVALKKVHCVVVFTKPILLEKLLWCLASLAL
jgi:hypothetical protein